MAMPGSRGAGDGVRGPMGCKGGKDKGGKDKEAESNERVLTNSRLGDWAVGRMRQ